MKKVFIFLMCLLGMMGASMSAKAQEITITLNPGWNWISYPNAEAMDIVTALGDFTPMSGDIINSQFGSTTYSGGRWRGGLTHFIPGWGYMYYSTRTDYAELVFAQPSSNAVATAMPTDITATTAVAGGMVMLPEGTHVFLRGVCWGTMPSPDIDGDHTTEETGIGSFSSTLVGLNPSTTYYVRAYAASDYGLAYGNELSFTTEAGGGSGGDAPTGAIDGKFIINADGDQVYFSQGNLQYIGSAATPYWKFADNQWDVLGTTTGQNSTNQNVDRDLFGWGTSGWNNGNTYYQSWSTAGYEESNYGQLYGPPGQYNLTGTYANADWGVYNPISNGGNQANQWRTLTQPEWDYVFNTRTTSSGIRYAKAKVNDMNGVILLPDNWSSDTYSLSNTNSSGASYSSNTISATQWSALEQAGAVFLPAAGYRNGTSVYDVGSSGYYWSASYSDSSSAWDVGFLVASLYTDFSDDRFGGQSVRLVAPAENSTVSTAEVTDITATTATCGGTIATDGGLAITARGVCWSTSHNPTIADSHTADGTGTGSFTSSLTGLSASTTYYVRAYATNSYVTIYGGEQSFTTEAGGGSGSDHAYVDLGLPSGLLWATCNVGAEAPEDYGDYFAWGETQPKDTYNWSTYQYYDGSNVTKYTGSDGLTTLLPEDDAATANWGSDWRMPTKEEWQELYNNTTVTWTTQNGVNGRLFTASNGNSLFLPAAGFRNYSNLYLAGSYGYYWSSSLDMGNPDYAWDFYFNSGNYSMGGNYRYDGQSVRPVAPAENSTVSTAEVTDITATTATCGGTIATDGGLAITARGVCWSTSHNPTIADSHTADGTGTGSFTSSLTGLSASTTYYVRAYATNSYVTIYGGEQSFTTEAGGGSGSDAPTGAIDGKFTINADGDQVYFSQGNLQYIGSASTPYWKFADNQWDVLGTTTGQNSSDQNVDRDLFGWGTSGWNNGNVYYQPYDTQDNGNNIQGYGYGPTDGTSYTYNLTGTYANADWGVYNPISNGGNQANQWRTLTHSEWAYVFNTRTTSSGIRYAKANVNDVNGVILLPDDWSSDTYSLSNTNSSEASYSSNTISATQWSALEQAGAVFLPAAGDRYGTSVYNVGSYGDYWSASCSSSGSARGVYFGGSNLNTDGSIYRLYGFSVRLARVAE